MKKHWRRHALNSGNAIGMAFAVVIFIAAEAGIAQAPPPQSTFKEDLFKRPDNAAIDYLLAAALLASPTTQEEIEAREFIEERLFNLPAKVLESRPDVVALLDKEASILRILREGAAKPTCQFDVDYTQGPNTLLSHCAVIRNMARHACGIAMMLETRGRFEEAAQVYCDVARLGVHIGQAPTMPAGALGMHIQHLALYRIEGLLAAEPSREAVETIILGIEAIPVHPFPIDRCLLGDMQVFGDWLKEHPDSLGSFASAEELPDVKIAIATFSTEDIVAAAQYYQEEMATFAELMSQPFYETRKKVVAEMARLEDAISRAWQNNDKKNMILSLLFSDVLVAVQVYKTRTEAQLGMMRLLAAAALCKAETGAYPADVQELAPYLPAGIPTDPFSGKKCSYILNNGFPRAECDLPQDIRECEAAQQAGRPNSYLFDLGARRNVDQEALKKFLEAPVE